MELTMTILRNGDDTTVVVIVPSGANCLPFAVMYVRKSG